MTVFANDSMTQEIEKVKKYLFLSQTFEVYVFAINMLEFASLKVSSGKQFGVFNTLTKVFNPLNITFQKEFEARFTSCPTIHEDLGQTILLDGPTTAVIESLKKLCKLGDISEVLTLAFNLLFWFYLEQKNPEILVGWFDQDTDLFYPVTFD